MTRLITLYTTCIRLAMAISVLSSRPCTIPSPSERCTLSRESQSATDSMPVLLVQGGTSLSLSASLNLNQESHNIVGASDIAVVPCCLGRPSPMLCFWKDPTFSPFETMLCRHACYSTSWRVRYSCRRTGKRNDFESIGSANTSSGTRSSNNLESKGV